MKLFFYSLAAIIICGLAVKLITELPPIYGNAIQKKNSAVAQHIVYVDTDKLMKMHPNNGTAREMERMLAEVDKIVNTELLGGAADENIVINIPAAGTEPISRKVLEADAANNAVLSLDELDKQKRTALNARMNSMRDTMMKSAETDINAQIKDIEKSTINSNRTVDEHYMMDRLNAQLKASALRVQTKVSGIDQDAVKAKLRAVEQSITDMDKASNTEKDSFDKKANDKANTLRMAAARKIEDKIRAYEDRENSRIISDKEEAQEQIVREIGLFGKTIPGNKNVAIAPLKQNNVKSENLLRSNTQASDLHTAAFELNTRIREDVNRVVLELAAEKGIKVTFKRSEGMHDATGMFAQWLREREWITSGPAMDERGS